MKGNLKILPRFLKYMGTFLLIVPFMPIALAYNSGVDPEKLDVITLRPGMQVTMNYHLGSPGGNGQSEQLFEVYDIPSSDKYDGSNAIRIWHKNEEMSYAPFNYSNSTDEPIYFAIAYHSWSPSGQFWSNLPAIGKTDLSENTVRIDYPKGGVKEPYLDITIETDPLNN